MKEPGRYLLEICFHFDLNLAVKDAFRDTQQYLNAFSTP
jgi:hypothetical protein